MQITCILSETIPFKSCMILGKGQEKYKKSSFLLMRLQFFIFVLIQNEFAKQILKVLLFSLVLMSFANPKPTNSIGSPTMYDSSKFIILEKKNIL